MDLAGRLVISSGVHPGLPDRLLRYGSLLVMLEVAESITPPTIVVDEDGALLTSRDVARILRVSPRTVARWTQSGALPCLLTPSGHRRYRDAVVRALIEPEPIAGV